MTVNMKSKVRKLRGSRTHGWGSPKKHRGSGSRGGRGMAGSGKKGQQKVIKLRKLGLFKLGKTQFKRPLKTITNDIIINLSQITAKLDIFTKEGIATKEKESYKIDLTKTQYTKVLGTGSLSHKLKIKAAKFSEKAVEKIKAAGGDIETFATESKDNKEKTNKETPVKTEQKS